MSGYPFAIIVVRGEEMEKALSEKKILVELSKLAVDEEVPVNHRIKALELLGKANRMFRDDETPCIGTVRIVDDIP